MIDAFGPEVAARTMVFFDGEKRGTAYKATYSLIKSRVAVAAFDDSNVTPTCCACAGNSSWAWCMAHAAVAAFDDLRVIPNSSLSSAHVCTHGGCAPPRRFTR